MYFLNVHGYQGHSGNNVFQMLNACFPDVEIISPQLVNKPSIDFSTLKRIVINKADFGIAFGKSLGGFYVCHLNKMFNMPCICINPSFEPWINNVFENEDLEFLSSHSFETFEFLKNITCLFEMTDERVNHLRAFGKFPFLKETSNYWYSTGSGHDFNVIETDRLIHEQIKRVVNYYQTEFYRYNEFFTDTNC